MKIDMSSFTHGSMRLWSNLTQALGLMAELDYGTSSMSILRANLTCRVYLLETENWRWMGDIRFVLGYIRGGTLFPCFSSCWD